MYKWQYTKPHCSNRSRKNIIRPAVQVHQGDDSGLVPDCQRLIKVIHDCRRYPKLRDGQNSYYIGDDAVHANQGFPHDQVHHALAEKPDDNQYELGNQAK